MNTIINLFGQINFLHVLWLFYVCFIIHELEEWNINDFEHRNFSGAPAASTHHSARMWIGFVLLAALLWFAAATLPGKTALAAYIIMPGIIIAMSNALQHVFWSLYFRQYAPGTVTALLLLLPLGGMIIYTALRQAYIPLWYVLLCAAPFVLMFIQTIRAGSRMVPAIKAINQLGILLSQRLRE